MKKIVSLFLALLLAAASLTACGKGHRTDDDGKIRVVVTVFPVYDWVVNIIGEGRDDVEVTLLLDKGVDLHSYQPSAEDIMKISTCDVFIYVGGESDEWVEDALKESVNDDVIVVNLLESMGSMAKEEEIVEGMEDDEDHEHGEEHDEDEHDEDEEETEYDEHIWLSLKNAIFLCDVIEQAFEKADPENAESYRANADAYIKKLEELDGKYAEAVASLPGRTVLFGDRFPFRYLTDDYGLKYYAAFKGCSAESEASFETIIFLAGKTDELSLKTILTIEGTDHRIAETIIENTASKDQKILVMDSLQSSAMDDYKEGRTYLSVMEGNLEVLKEALK